VHLFYFREAWRSFKQQRGIGTTAILSLTAVLTLCGIFLLLARNAELAMNLMGDRREMVVYLHDDVSSAQRDALLDRIRQLYGDVTYVSKEQAWDEFSQQVGDPALLEAVGGNPLPASLRVKLRPELLSFAKMDEAAKQVAAFPEVEDVRYGGEWVKRLDAIASGLKRGSLGVGILVGLAMVFVMYNTIRLTALSRRPQVEIMVRLGATDGFIATPFVIEAMFQAVLSAVLALGVVLALQKAMVAQVVTISFFPVPWVAVFLGSAIVLAWFAAMLALTRVLRTVGA
jgi:cell division transport system permease protein